MAESNAVQLELRSQNEHDMSASDLQRLRTAILDANPALAVGTDVAPTYGSGNDLVDEILIWLPTAAFLQEYVYGKVFDAVVDFMKTRFGRPGEEDRPRRITYIYGPDNRVLRRIEITDPNEDVPGPEDDAD